MNANADPQKVDYDRLAAVYHRRYEDSPMVGTEAALKALLADLKPARVLEAGCGTGHWLHSLRGHAAWLAGLDRSQGMLAEARRRRADNSLVLGDACALPFVGEAFELIFVVNALHHFADPAAFLLGASHSLRPGGCLALIGMDIISRLQRWYVYDYFPETVLIDRERFPTWAQVAGWLEIAGFKPGSRQVVETFKKNWKGRAVFDDPFLQKESNSTLVLLDDAAYAAGLERVEQAILRAETRGESIAFTSVLEISLQIAWKPPE